MLAISAGAAVRVLCLAEGGRTEVVKQKPPSKEFFEGALPGGLRRQDAYQVRV